VTTDVVASTDVREVVASYKTGFSFLGREAPRAHNIEVAASRLDGLVLLPGQIVSFNAEVGPRTVDAGFDRAFQIYKGEMVEGVGGGTCQVASTFHAAAVYGGLDIVERAPHSRPLGYVPLGLDATVVYPEVDLKIRNPWNFPVAVHAFVEKGLVTVEIHAPRRTGPVLVSTETLKVWPFTRKVEVHPELASGRFIRKEKGIRGYDIRVVRRSTSVDGIPHLETSIDRYPATPELFWVAPGFDVEHALPPPPEGEVPSATSDADPKPADSTVIPG
jgi:vancomycin resistance protein YoaR